MSTSPADNSYLLSSFLFHLRTPLHSIKSASQVAKQFSERIPLSVLVWLEKWRPVIDTWIFAEAEAHSLKRDGEVHNWEQIVFEMAENMKDVTIAYDETKSFEAPDSEESKMVINLASNGIKYLNEIIQPIRNKDYHFLLS